MSYTVIEEFIVQRGDSATHYSKVGSKVELSDEEAAELLAAGKIARPGEEPSAEVATAEPVAVRTPYTILDEFIVQRGDSAVHYSDVGKTADLSDEEAAEQIAAGTVAAAKQAAESEPSAEDDMANTQAWLDAEQAHNADVTAWLEAEKAETKQARGRRDT